MPKDNISRELIIWLLLFIAGAFASMFFVIYRIVAIIFFLIFFAMTLKKTSKDQKLSAQGDRLVIFFGNFLGAVLRGITWPVFLIWPYKHSDKTDNH